MSLLCECTCQSVKYIWNKGVVGCRLYILATVSHSKHLASLSQGSDVKHKSDGILLFPDSPPDGSNGLKLKALYRLDTWRCPVILCIHVLSIICRAEAERTRACLYTQINTSTEWDDVHIVSFLQIHPDKTCTRAYIHTYTCMKECLSLTNTYVCMWGVSKVQQQPLEKFLRCFQGFLRREKRENNRNLGGNLSHPCCEPSPDGFKLIDLSCLLFILHMVWIDMSSATYRNVF